MSKVSKQQQHQNRKRRCNVRARKSGLPRLLVFKSNKAVYAHIINDAEGKIVCGTSGLKASGTGIERAKSAGEAVAKLAAEKKITSVVFDRNGYRYHGQIAALAEGARAGGLQF